MWGTGVPRRNDAEAGYASLAAMVLCAALSILCAGLLTLDYAQKKQAERQFYRLRQAEAINAAVLRFAGDIVYAPDRDEITADTTIDNPDGPAWRVHLVAQSEATKWPFGRIDEVSDVTLAHVTRLSRDDVLARAKAGHDDCVLSLFSDFGFADPARDRPRGKGALFISTAKDGEIWRIRAVSGNRVEERRVRFLGETTHVFALLSKEEFSLGEMPDCTDLIATQ